jgi:hypothetical protein
VQKRDRFVGLQADAKGGELTTVPLTFDGDRLELNVDCGGLGETWVALLDADGNPISGFTMSDFDTIDLNQLHAACTWRESGDLRALAGKPLRLHIRLRSATLYAFRFVAN